MRTFWRSLKLFQNDFLLYESASIKPRPSRLKFVTKAFLVTNTRRGFGIDCPDYQRCLKTPFRRILTRLLKKKETKKKKTCSRVRAARLGQRDRVTRSALPTRGAGSCLQELAAAVDSRWLTLSQCVISIKICFSSIKTFFNLLEFSCMEYCVCT